MNEEQTTRLICLVAFYAVVFPLLKSLVQKLWGRYRARRTNSRG